MKSGKKPLFGIRIKIMLAVLICVLLVGVSVGIISIIRMNDHLLEQCRSQTSNLARIAANHINTERLLSIKEGDEGSEDFNKIAENLRSFLTDDVEYIYTMRKVDGELQFVVDADEEDPADIGEPYETYDEIEEAFEGKDTIDSEVTSDEWGSYFSAFSPIFDEEGNVVAIVGVDCSINAINEKIADYRNLIILIEVICIAVGIALAAFVSVVISRKLTVVDAKLSELADSRGQLGKRLDINSSDEVGSIANSMNRFLEHLHTIISGIAQGEEELMAVSGDIRQSMDSSTDGIKCIVTTMDTLKSQMGAMNRQAEMISRNANANGELTDVIMKETSDSVAHTSKISEQAEHIQKNAIEVKENIQTTIKNITETLESQIQDAKKVEEIQKLTDTIVSIASETNMLSLNASIEAARAGESGKGFAVVADQIGKLASESTQTASEIGKINKMIMNIVSNLTQSSQNLLSIINNQVLGDYDLLVDTGKQYHEDTLQFQKQMLNFSDKMKELKQSMQDILVSVSEIVDAVKEESDEVTTNVSMLNEVQEHIEEVNQSVTQNEEIVHHMNDLIGQFQL